VSAMPRGGADSAAPSRQPAASRPLTGHRVLRMRMLWVAISVLTSDGSLEAHLSI